eukprot:CAMPEP_0118952858 /NCGR_PEP_ID=MMETSP1169-20130426/55577_1 /TAXON_ID=36882 /ORGANISM="Pyramimonas obovata, Strain CCMP722" /LENGTH=352 /DNA_ID=CAMNT_0006900199 /DNA_START=111 /DNA_END=1166 /DNA_ORIENTATION=-
MDEIKLTPEEATARLRRGGFVLCMDVPAEREIGCDCVMWQVGAKFQGLKMIPPGIHLLVYEAGHGSRIAEFVAINAGDVIVRRWDPVQEDIAPNSGFPEDQVERLVHGVRNNDFDGSMGPYPVNMEKLWARSAGFITLENLTRAGVPPGTRILPGDPDEDERQKKEGAIAPYFADQGRVARFTPLWPGAPAEATGSQRRRVDGMSAAEVTAFNMDSSARLLAVIEQHCGGNWQLLIGEFQLAFALFSMVSSMAAFQQWRDVLQLFCMCDEALATHPHMFHAFMETLRVHMEHIPEDFFADELAAENFLRPLLARHLANIRAAAGPAASRGKQAAGTAANEPSLPNLARKATQ